MHIRLIACGSACMVALSVIVLSPSDPDAQPRPDKTYRVAHLSTAGRTPDGTPPRPLKEGLRDFGYVEGRNVLYEARFAEGRVERLPELAAELVALGVDVIVAQGRPAVVAAKQATSVIPIVIAPASSDAVTTGLITSLARPGGNVTGLTDELSELHGESQDGKSTRTYSGSGDTPTSRPHYRIRTGIGRPALLGCRAPRPSSPGLAMLAPAAERARWASHSEFAMAGP